MKKKKLIIFDLDGTLLDTIEDLAMAVNHALQQFNFPTHPTDSYRFMVGNGINRLLERAMPAEHRNMDMIQMVRIEFIKYYFKNADAFTRPYEGIPELLTALDSQGYMLGVASNKIHEATVELVERFFPNIKFLLVLGQREGIPVKPSPDILHEIIAKAGTEKHETLYIGDSGVDASTAINAGVDFVGVLWGFRPQSELEAAGARVFAGEAEDILKMLE